jgi:hypothetical protein
LTVKNRPRCAPQADLRARHDHGVLTAAGVVIETFASRRPGSAFDIEVEVGYHGLAIGRTDDPLVVGITVEPDPHGSRRVVVDGDEYLAAVTADDRNARPCQGSSSRP